MAAIATDPELLDQTREKRTRFPAFPLLYASVQSAYQVGFRTSGGEPNPMQYRQRRAPGLRFTHLSYFKTG